MQLGSVMKVMGMCAVVGSVWAIAPAPAAAAACNYTGPAGGAWTTAANWSCAAVPGAADDVTIDTGDDVALGTPVTVQSLTRSPAPASAAAPARLRSPAPSPGRAAICSAAAR